MSVEGYRMDLMHTNCIRAGYLDLDGCTVVDLLPSFFKPTCSICSTPYLAPGVSAVRGDSSLAVCRECHKRMSEFSCYSQYCLGTDICRLQDTRGQISPSQCHNRLVQCLITYISPSAADSC